MHLSQNNSIELLQSTSNSEVNKDFVSNDKKNKCFFGIDAFIYFL